MPWFKVTQLFWKGAKTRIKILGSSILFSIYDRLHLEFGINTYHSDSVGWKSSDSPSTHTHTHTHTHTLQFNTNHLNTVRLLFLWVLQSPLNLIHRVNPWMWNPWTWRAISYKELEHLWILVSSSGSWYQISWWYWRDNSVKQLELEFIFHIVEV